MIVDTRITSSFPAFLFYELSTTMTLENSLMFGGSFSYGSTGGRIHYSDYSGEIGSDQLIHFFALTPSIGTSFTFHNDTWKLLADLRPGFVYTEFEFNVYQRIGSSRDSESMDFTSLNISVQPTLSLQKKFGRVGMHTTIGYHVTVLPGNLYSKDYDEAYLIDNNEKEIRADWSGLRFGIGAFFILRKRNKSDKAPDLILID
jgi:hypothetical protein